MSSPDSLIAEVRLLNKIQAIILEQRLALVLLFNSVLWAAVYALSLGLRFDFDPAQAFLAQYFTIPLALLILFRLLAYKYWDLNQGYWRYVSTHDLVLILKAHLASSLLFTSSVLFLRVPGFPRSVFLIEFAFSILFCGGSRLLVRLFCERFLSSDDPDGSLGSRDVIVIGAGDSGHLLIKTLLSSKRLPYRPVSVLDDTERLQGALVHGVRIDGKLSELKQVLTRYPKVSAVIVAIPSFSELKWQETKAICDEAGLLIKRLQSFEDIACLDAQVPQTELSIESVLEKEVRIEHEEEIRRELHQKTVLVTGAGGSIGSEIVRQLLQYQPKKIVLLDNSEYNLYRINREIKALKTPIELSVVLADICDEDRLHQVFKAAAPDLVFHAAAYKHVPLMEENCYEAFKNNILGTRAILRMSHIAGVKRFVMISTDKAVDPSSIMGCSKRIAELVVQDYAQSAAPTDNTSTMNTAVVRFGNVINSAGSVVPLFKEQILSGGPVTVTHPDMERYFMSIREAVRLVLTAGILGDRGEIYVLDMGRPIKIIDVAKKMLSLYGRRDIKIVFSGIRPGEKLTEELTGVGEKRSGTNFRKVERILGAVPAPEDVNDWISRLQAVLREAKDNEIGKAMMKFAASARQAPPSRSIQAQADEHRRVIGQP